MESLEDSELVVYVSVHWYYGLYLKFTGDVQLFRYKLRFEELISNLFPYLIIYFQILGEIKC